MNSLSIFTLGIIGITVLVSYLAFSRVFVYEKYSFEIEGILKHREWKRMLTSIFLHADWSHLIFNMFSLFSFSSIIEHNFGTVTTASIYFFSGLAGNFLALILHRRNPSYRAVGASGAVAGIIFASIFLVPGGSILIFPLPIPVPAWTYAFIFILATLYGVGLQSGDIGHEAHLGGALAGVGSAVYITPSIITEQPLLLGAVVIPVILFFFYLKVTHR